MNYLPLILRVAAIFSAFVACSLYFLSSGKLSKQRQELANTQSELNVLANEKNLLDLEVALLQEKLTTETRLLEESRTKLEEAQAQSDADREEIRNTQEALEKAEKDSLEIEEVATRLRQELVRKEQLLASANQEGTIDQLNDRIQKLTITNNQLREEIRTLVKQTPAGAGSSNGNTLAYSTAASLKETRIASVSAPNGIIVLNATPELDLTQDSTIQLVKGLEIVGKIKIVSVNGSLAIANILPESKTEQLNQGDIVKLLP